jgi:transcriptional regulator with XRE-family HTH domain
MDPQLTLGRGIAEQRRRHGLSQPELARMLDRPVSWVSRVERGLGRTDPISVLEAVACALGTPLPARGGVARACAAPQAAVRGLRLAARAAYPGGAREGHPVPAAFLREQADRAWVLTCARRYDELADLLAVLLPDLDAALASAAPPQRAPLLELRSDSYQACSAALARLGQHESAKAAASRALTAAQRAGNLMLAAASAYLLVCIHMESGRYEHADETACRAAAALAGPVAEGSAQAIALRGALTLQRALIAARTGNPAAASYQLGRAGELAGLLSRGGCAPDAGFGPGHVALYELAVSLEADQPRGAERPSGGPAETGQASISLVTAQRS